MVNCINIIVSVWSKLHFQDKGHSYNLRYRWVYYKHRRLWSDLYKHRWKFHV